MKTLLLKNEAGQWMYMIIATNPCAPLDPTTRVVVEWQYGTYDMQTTARQAAERYGKCEKTVVL